MTISFFSLIQIIKWRDPFYLILMIVISEERKVNVLSKIVFLDQENQAFPIYIILSHFSYKILFLLTFIFLVARKIGGEKCVRGEIYYTPQMFNDLKNSEYQQHVVFTNFQKATFEKSLIRTLSCFKYFDFSPFLFFFYLDSSRNFSLN